MLPLGSTLATLAKLLRDHSFFIKLKDGGEIMLEHIVNPYLVVGGENRPAYLPPPNALRITLIFIRHYHRKRIIALD